MMSLDLTTKYGNLMLKSPVIVGACPLTAEELIRIAIVNAGAGAIVLPSLFEEQVILWNERAGHIPSSLTPHDENVLARAKRMQLDTACADAESYLRLVERASSQLSIPVIASLNGECAGNWLEFALELQAAGADAIELNVRNPLPSEYPDPREAEDAIVNTATRIHDKTSIPLFLKLDRSFTSLSHLATRLIPVVQGLVLFGRSPAFDIELDSFHVTTSWGLTEPGSIVNSLESIMRVHAYCPEMPLAANGGIGSSGDLIKVLLAGADVGMVTSAIYRDGPTAVGTLIEGLIHFMERHQMQSLEDLNSKCPSVFDCDQDRLDYITSVSSKLDSGHVRVGRHVTECDRYGHPRAPH
jgi:dihydroorotate dehydrogenase (fumarate)